MTFCMCDFCSAFCAEDNYDNYLCEGCDPFVYEDEDEGDDEYEYEEGV